MDIFYIIGNNIPFILTIISCYLLFDKTNLLFYYIIGLFSNSLLNLILKGIIQQPRPSFKNTYLATNHAKHFFYQNGIPFDLFGMPSAHAQSAFFSTMYIYLALKKIYFFYIYLFLSILTCIQRITFNFHSLEQVIVGSILGTFFAIPFYFLSNQNIKGNITEKIDDFGPI